MKRMTGTAAVLLAVGLAAAPAAAGRYGSFTLQPGETQQIDITPAAQEMYVCNDFFSHGAIAIRVGGKPHVLQPGLCTDTVIGDKILATNEGSGPAMATYRFSPGPHGIDKFPPR